jgi:hypothetical protein
MERSAGANVRGVGGADGVSRARHGAGSAEARQLGTRNAGARRRVRAVVMQRGGSARTRTEGAVGPRVEDVGGCQGKAADEGRWHYELLVENGGGPARTAAEGATLMQADHGPRGGGGAVMAWRAGRKGSEVKAATGCDELEGARCSQARRAPFIHAEVEAGATRRGFDAQRKTDGGGRPALIASQQVERAEELQDPKVKADLDSHVCGCERECSTGGRLGSIPQACACARQQATREQVKGQWCESRTGAVHRRCDQARRSCRRLRGCADRVSAAHVREQRRLSP